MFYVNSSIYFGASMYCIYACNILMYFIYQVFYSGDANILVHYFTYFSLEDICRGLNVQLLLPNHNVDTFSC